MQQHGRIIGLAVAAALMAAPAAVQAVDVYVKVGPPAARVEAVPAPRAGYVWAPGYWGWRGGKWVWGPGYWLRERAGYHWVPDAWEQGDRGYHWVPGHWAR